MKYLYYRNSAIPNSMILKVAFFCEVYKSEYRQKNLISKVYFVSTLIQLPPFMDLTSTPPLTAPLLHSPVMASEL